MILKTDLMQHQRAAVEKLLPIRVGALFMDMGTGKTRTAIEIAALRQGRYDRVIWYCPVSLKQTIRQEIIKHVESPDIYVADDKTDDANIPDADWVIVGLESVGGSDRVALAVNAMTTENTFVIVDESSFIKSHTSKRARRLTAISDRCRYRMVLTGTPISQGVVDLYSQMLFLSPKILGYRSFYSFAANHLEYHERYTGMITRSLNTEYLAAKIAPYTYQVTKEECLDLPKKIHEHRYFDLTSEQREWYEKAKVDILDSIADEDFDSIDIFRLFTILQQIACGFWNNTETKKFHEFSHRRIDTLLDTIEDIRHDEKIIVWAKYIYDIHGIIRALSGKYGDNQVSAFYGDLNEKERNKQVDKFQSGARFFVATPACGGHGLNALTEAAYAIFYNDDFKYSTRLQAEDRCHRIGQTRKPTYISIVACCGIEERIQQALYKKGNAVDRFKHEVNEVKDKKELIAKL